MTEPVYREDAYLRSCEAHVIGVDDRGAILLDRTVFFPTGGGQPGDIGVLERMDGTQIRIGATVLGEDKRQIAHLATDDVPLLEIGEPVVGHIDWARRYRHMRMHTALHIICAAMRTKITGCQIGAEESRIDLDTQDPPQREAVEDAIKAAVDADHAVTMEWITDGELDANPDLIKSMSVAPPRGTGRIRLVRIGSDFDLQPCGGTHVASTIEVGPIAVTKIEKKGRLNRRIRIRFAD